MSRARVLHILGTADDAGTGISRLVQILATNGDQARYDHVVCFISPPGPWMSRLEDAGVRSANIEWGWRYDLPAAVRLWSSIRASRADLVHVHYGGRFIRAVVRAASTAPLVLHLHGRSRETGGFRPLTVPARDVSLVIATSRAVAAVVEAREVRVIYPAIQSSAASAPPAAPTEPIVGAAGRLVPIKGYDHLLTAFAIVLETAPRARLEIAGDGPERARLEQLSVQLGISPRVAFLGWRRDLNAIMPRWSVFVQPSLEEAVGVTVMEAMAAGLPVVASDVGGLPEIVEHGVTGILAKPGAPHELAEATAMLLLNHDCATRLGETGRSRTPAFSSTRFTSEIQAVYAELLHRG